MIKQTNINLFFDICCKTKKQAKSLAEFLTPTIGGILIPTTDRDEIIDLRDTAICGTSIYFTGTYNSFCFDDDVFLGLLDHWMGHIDNGIESMKVLVHQLTLIEGDMSYFACYEYNRAYNRLRVSYLYQDHEESKLDTYMYDAMHTDKSMTERLLKEQGKIRAIDLADGEYGWFDDDYMSWHMTLKQRLDKAHTDSKKHKQQ